MLRIRSKANKRIQRMDVLRQYRICIFGYTVAVVHVYRNWLCYQLRFLLRRLRVLHRANAGALLLVLARLERCRTGYRSRVPALPPARPAWQGCVQAARGWAAFVKGSQSKTQSTESTQPAPSLSPRVLAGVSVPTWNQKQRFLDSEVAAVTNFKPRSRCTRSRENFNENGFLIWTELRVFAIAEERLECLGPENPPFNSAQGKTPYGKCHLR